MLNKSFKTIGIILVLFIIFTSNCKKKNKPPETPLIPSGPTIGVVDNIYIFSTSSTDPDEDSISYQFNWGNGDGDTSNWSANELSGNPFSMSHSWSTPDIYYIKARAKDKHGATSEWSEPCSLRIIIDEPPLTPTKPSGLDSGKINVSCNFASSTIDPDGDLISIRFDWGNGDTSDWSVFNSCGDTITTSYAWLNPGTYLVKTQAKDVYDMTSSWSDGLSVRINAIGALKWRFQTRGHISSSPAIASDGTIYVGGMTYLYAITPDGEVKWSYKIGDDEDGYSAAIGHDGTIYFVSNFNIYAMTPDGKLKWNSQTGGSSGHLAIGSDGTIYVGLSAPHFFALNPDGTLKWEYITYSWCTSPIVIGLDGTIYFSMVDRNLYALNPNGTLKWCNRIGHLIERLALAISSDSTIYAGADDGLYALNPDGTIKWCNQTGSSVSSLPAIGPDSTVYFGTYDNYLYAIYGSGQLASSSWPMFYHDLKHTGLVDGP